MPLTEQDLTGLEMADSVGDFGRDSKVSDAVEELRELRARVAQLEALADAGAKAMDALESIGGQARQRIVDLAGWLRYALENWAPGGSDKVEKARAALERAEAETPAGADGQQGWAALRAARRAERASEPTVRTTAAPPRLRDLLTPTDPDVIGWSPGELLYAEPEIRAKATHVVPLLPCYPPSALDPYKDRSPRGLLAVLETPGSDHVSFVVVEWVSGPVDLANLTPRLERQMEALYQPLFHGEGPSGTLRELRHTHWGHADDGYLHEPNGALIAAAFEALKPWFDCWRRT